MTGEEISLREFICAKLNAMESRVQLQFDAQAKALDTANDRLQERLAGMNEFRDAMKDQAANFVTRAELRLELEAASKGRRDNIALFISIVSFGFALWRMLG